MLQTLLIADHKNVTKSATGNGHYDVEDFDALIPNWNKRRFEGFSSDSYYRQYFWLSFGTFDIIWYLSSGLILPATTLRFPNLLLITLFTT